MHWPRAPESGEALAWGVLSRTGMNLRLLLVVGWMGLALSGCVSTGMARTVNKGQLQVVAAPSVHRYDDGVLTQGEVGVRYGVGERVDVGARLVAIGVQLEPVGPQIESVGVAVDTRVGLVRAPSLDRGVDLTLAPLLSVMARSHSDDKQVSVELPLLVGLNPGAGVQVVLGPRVGTTVVVDPSGVGRFEPGVGCSLGISLPVLPWVRLVPEMTVRRTLSDTTPIFQGSLGVLVGGYREE